MGGACSTHERDEKRTQMRQGEAVIVGRIILYDVKVKMSLCFFNRAPHHEGQLEEWRYSSAHPLTSELD